MARPRFLHRKNTQHEQGFSLAESMAGLVIATVTLTAAAPLFLRQHISNINSEIRTGATSVAQQILDDLRFQTQSRTHSSPPPGTIQIKTELSSMAPANSKVLNVKSTQGFHVGQRILVGSSKNSHTIQSIESGKIALTEALGSDQVKDAKVSLSGELGHRFDATVHICTEPPKVKPGSVDCPTSNASSTSSRYIVVQIENDGQPIYTVETFYTPLRENSAD
ncbi:hypothetical protein GS597_08440 [Synechococcales cyanobacterium C]|uniref:Uncharacterized protein n=1 Tax=Petrachloros mirabilis ULC683 TaxID=2781853 RepID=A0A8K2A7X2_9CYAN|nr:hypothetical protein [Petrachloros mirabilis]NCJ06535.1 hypothetical protein [Petrachloros mirabilis ULC683]